MRRPRPRGPLGRELDLILQQRPGTTSHLEQEARFAVRRARQQERDVLDDGDIQATLLAMYELHYRGLDGVDERWEWNPSLLAARAVLEEAFESRLRELVHDVEALGELSLGKGMGKALFDVVAADDGPELSKFLERKATLEQWREFLTHRSTYQLKEADPHAWGIPRLAGRAKVALVEIEADEFGCGLPDRMHATLFAQTMREVGLDDTYGASVDVVPAVTLAHLNAMSLFGLHRRWRGALVGHLAAFEMTSSIPNRRYGNGLRRLGYGEVATDYFDEHVEADAVHEQIAAHDMCGSLVEAEPGLAADVLFGARVALALDALVSGHMLRCWQDERSSLLCEGRHPVRDGEAAGMGTVGSGIT